MLHVRPAPPQWILNEVQADPDAANGDANGDGTSSTTQDEFVELYNPTNDPVSLANWQVDDGIDIDQPIKAGREEWIKYFERLYLRDILKACVELVSTTKSL